MDPKPINFDPKFNFVEVLNLFPISERYKERFFRQFKLIWYTFYNITAQCSKNICSKNQKCFKWRFRKIRKDSKFKSDWVEQAKIASWYIEDCAGKMVNISHLVFGRAQFLVLWTFQWLIGVRWSDLHVTWTTWVCPGWIRIILHLSVLKYHLWAAFFLKKQIEKRKNGDISSKILLFSWFFDVFEIFSFKYFITTTYRHLPATKRFLIHGLVDIPHSEDCLHQIVFGSSDKTLSQVSCIIEKWSQSGRLSCESADAFGYNLRIQIMENPRGGFPGILTR